MQKQPAQWQGQLFEVLHAREKHGGRLRAEDGRWLEMHGEKWGAGFFPEEARAEGGAGSQHEIKGGAAGGTLFKRTQPGLYGLTCLLKDQSGAVVEPPEAGVGDELLKVTRLADRHGLHACLLHDLAKNAGGDDGDLMSALAEELSQPEERQHISSAAKGEEGDAGHLFE